MSVYSKIFIIGNESKDGLEDIYVEILQGEGEKRWFEAKYDEEKFQRLGNIHAVIPKDRDDKNSILDACLAFVPGLFEQCHTLEKVKVELKDINTLDFSTGKHIPETWNMLREEAKDIFKEIHLYEAPLMRYKA